VASGVLFLVPAMMKDMFCDPPKGPALTVRAIERHPRRLRQAERNISLPQISINWPTVDGGSRWQSITSKRREMRSELIREWTRINDSTFDMPKKRYPWPTGCISEGCARQPGYLEEFGGKIKE